MIGVIIGTLFSNQVALRVHDKLVSLTLTQAQSSAHSGGTVLDNSTLAGMLVESTLCAQDAVILAHIQICVIGVMVWLHAAYLSRKKPGKLLGV